MLKAAGKAAAHRLLGLRFPREYGGRGLDWRSEIVALEGDALSNHREEEKVYG